MLAGAGVDRQHEHESSWAAGPVGRGGRCGRELHADAERRVYARQLAVGQVTLIQNDGLMALQTTQPIYLVNNSICSRPGSFAAAAGSHVIWDPDAPKLHLSPSIRASTWCSIAA